MKFLSRLDDFEHIVIDGSVSGTGLSSLYLKDTATPILRIGNNTGDSFITYDGSELSISSDVDLRFTTPTDQDVFLITSTGNIITTQAGGTFTIGGGLTLPAITGGFLKTDANGVVSVDNSSYLTNETDTLDSVTDRGATTTNAITTGDITISNGYPKISLFDTDNSAAFEIKGAGGSAQYIVSGTTKDHVFYAGSTSTQLMRINGDGNVGIGTTNPTATLTVVGNQLFDGTGINLKRTGVLSGRTWNFGVDSNGLSIYDVTSSAYRLTIDSSGNVGIGTTGPLSKLHVDVDGSAARFSRSTAQYFDFNMDAANSNLDFYVGSNGKNVNLTIKGSHNGAMTFGTQDTERMRITDGGNVGIGTTSPDHKLTVYTDATSGVELVGQDGGNQNSDSSKIIFNGHAQDNGPFIQAINTSAYGVKRLGFFTDRTASDYTTLPTESMSITNTGNVGIGKTDPSAPLHINGGSTNQVVKIQSNSAPYIRFKEGGTDVGFIQFGTDTYISNQKDGTLNFRTNNTDKMTILSNGNVGIGNTNPNVSLVISRSGVESVLTLDSSDDNAIINLKADSGGTATGYNTDPRLVFSTGDVDKAYIIWDESEEKFAISADFDASTPWITSDLSGNIAFPQYGAGYLKSDASGNITVDTSTIEDTLDSVTDRGATTTNSISVGEITGSKSVDGDVNFRFKNTSTGTSSAGNVWIYSEAYSTIRFAKTSTDSQRGKITYDFANEAMSFRTNAVDDRLYINSSGNVGINTTNPGAKLDVIGNGRFYSAIGVNDNVRTGIAHYDTTAQVANVGGQLVLGYKYHDNGSYTEGAILKMYKLNSTSGDYSSGLKFQVRNTGDNLSTKMTLDPSGNLGIGTTGPVYKLDVVGNQRIVNTGGSETFLVETNYDRVGKFHSTDSGAFLAIQDNNSTNNGVGINVVGNTLSLKTSNSAHLYIAADGDVGIGTTNPLSTLHVSDATDISMSAGGAGQFAIEGNGYTGAIALDATAMHIYHNSANRALVLGTNETAAITIHKSNQSLDFNSYGSGTFTGTAAYALAVDSSGNVIETSYIPSSSSTDFVAVTGDEMTGNLLLGDSVELRLGTDTDLKIYHDGTVGRIANNTGHLYIQNLSDDKDIYLRSDDGSGGLSTYLSIDGSNSLVNITKPLTLSNYGAGYLKTDANGVVSVDTSTIEDTLQTVTDRGNTTTNNLRISNSSPDLFFETGATHYNWMLAAQENVDAAFEISVGSQDADSTDDTWSPKLVVKQSGNVGIGTTNPTTKLYVDAGESTFNRGNSDGAIARFRGKNAEKAVIGTVDSWFASNVGIGTTSPKTQLHLNDGGSFNNTDANNRLFIERDDHAYVLMSTPDGKDQGIHFHNTTDNALVGRIAYQHRSTGDSLRFRVGSSNNSNEFLILNSDGTIQIQGYGAGILTTDASGNITASTSVATSSTLDDVTDNGNTTTNTITTSDITVNSSGVGSSGLTIKRSSSSGRSQMMFASETGTQIWRTGLTGGGSSNFAFFDGTQNALTLELNGDILMTPGGNVGIGTTNPSSKLDVVGNTRLGPDSEHAFQVTDDSANNFLVLSSTQRTTASAARDIKFRSYGTDATDNVLVMDMSAGRVGIGTDSPTKLLTVGSGATASGISNNGIYVAVDGGAAVTARNTTNEVEVQLNAEVSQGTLGTFTNHPLAFRVNNSNKMWIDTSGNVGINTTSPGGRLHVVGNVLVQSGRVYTDAIQGYQYNSITIGDGNSTFNIISRDNEDVAITGTGNVGIGTVSPATKLHVVGTAETRLRVGSSNASSNVVLELRDENTPTGQGTVITYNNSTGETYFNNALSTATTDFHFQSGEYGTANDFFTLSNSGGNSILHLKTTGGDSFITYEDATNELAVASDGDLRLTTPTDQDVFFISSGGNIDMTQAGGTVDMGGDLVVDGDITGNSNAYIDGKVGIGTTSPVVKLDVNGSIRTTGRNIPSSGKGLELFYYSPSDLFYIEAYDYTNSLYKAIRYAGLSHQFITGNVGVSTTNPVQPLTVQAASNANTIGLLGRSNDNNSRIDFLNNAGTSRILTVLAYDSANQIYGDTDIPLTISTNATERMRIAAGGNVGIGTTSPSSKLHVSNPDTTANQLALRVDQNDGSAAIANFYQGGTETHSLTTTGTNSGIITIKSGGTNVISLNTSGDSYLNGGNVGIGTTSPQQALHIKGATNALMMLEGDNDNGLAGCYYKTEDTDNTMNRTKGFFGFRGNHAYGLGYFTMWLDTVGDNGQVTSSEEKFRWLRSGDFHADGDVIAYSTTTPSDIRLKTDVETIESASEKVSKLRGVEYTWSKGKLAGQREIGLIAQEVEAVVPEVVKEKELPLWDDSGESYKTVDYEKLVALLIESNKEMQEEIKQLKERLDGFTK